MSETIVKFSFSILFACLFYICYSQTHVILRNPFSYGLMFTLIIGTPKMYLERMSNEFRDILWLTGEETLEQQLVW